MPRALSVVAAALFLLAGCGPSRADIEHSIRDEMKNGMNVEITKIDLAKQPDGGYTGTATATTGDVYDVEVQAPKGNRSEWKALPTPAVLEKQLAKNLGAKLGDQLKSVHVNKIGGGLYAATVILASGERLEMRSKMVGNQVMFEPINP